MKVIKFFIWKVGLALTIWRLKYLCHTLRSAWRFASDPAWNDSYLDGYTPYQAVCEDAQYL